MNNFEYLKSLSLEEYAKERIDKVPLASSGEWIGDFLGYCSSYEEAYEKEVKWLKDNHEITIEINKLFEAIKEAIKL